MTRSIRKTSGTIGTSAPSRGKETGDKSHRRPPVDTGLPARLFQCSLALVHPAFQRVIRHVQPPCVNGIALTVTLFSLTFD